eukprot:TRINITY_DN945_c0_g1_i1.p1 TRINITY_DN945_c0_g1~~TRINITY_DN945_c0_g1_i1.p1  ORF type:complete len:159 (+),score=27.53 TRINITY_DN945_c0_g1_i1:420-896(+)
MDTVPGKLLTKYTNQKNIDISECIDKENIIDAIIEFYTTQRMQILRESDPEELFRLRASELKQILDGWNIPHKDCIEKSELVDKVRNYFQITQSQETEEQRMIRKSADECVICMDNVINTVFLECGHMAVCKECARTIDVCCICRENITRVVDVYRVY